MSQPLLYTILSVFVISACSFVGTYVLTVRESFVARSMIYLVSFATGAVLGTVFLHLLPESMEHADSPLRGSMLVFAGLLMAFFIEKFIHWHHCHRVEHDDEAGRHTHPVGPLIIIGDGIHNFIDGMLIASAFAVNVPLGIATATAIVLHEVPQELSDMALLLHSGMSRGKALMWNTLSSCAAILGAGVAILFAQHVEGIEFILIPIAAGNFLYIATTDLIPELHKETRIGKTVMQVLLVALGVGLMAYLSLARGHPEELYDHSDVHDEEVPGNLQIQIMDADGNPMDGSMGVRVRTR